MSTFNLLTSDLPMKQRILIHIIHLTMQKCHYATEETLRARNAAFVSTHGGQYAIHEAK